MCMTQIIELGKNKGFYGVVDMKNLYVCMVVLYVWETYVWKKENECFKVQIKAYIRHHAHYNLHQQNWGYESRAHQLVTMMAAIKCF